MTAKVCLCAPKRVPPLAPSLLHNCCALTNKTTLFEVKNRRKNAKQQIQIIYFFKLIRRTLLSMKYGVFGKQLFFFIIIKN